MEDHCALQYLVTFERDIHVTETRAPFASIAVSLRCLLQAVYEGIGIRDARGGRYRTYP